MSMTLIEHIEVGSGGTSGIVFDNIPQIYTDIKILFSITTTRASISDWIYFKINDSTANQTGRVLYGTGSGVASFSGLDLFVSGTQVTANTFANSEVTFPNYAGSANKSFSADSVYENNATGATQTILAGLWSQTAAITKLELYSGNSATIEEFSSATLYGITSAVEPITYTLPVTSDLYAWYDAANTSTITASSGLISEWADSSGNGIDAVQADTAFQPSFGAVVCNGVVVPYFNVDRLIATASLTGNALTVFTVGSKELAVSGSSLYSRWASIWKSGAGANDYNNTNSILGVWAATVYVYGNNTQIATVNTTAANGIHNSAFRLDGSAVKLWHNGATATGTTSVSLNADRITIGDAAQGTGDSYLNGFVAEHIIYNRALTDQEVADVQTYLANKWGLS